MGELLDERKNEAMIFGQQLSKLATIFRLAIFRNDAGASKVLIDLFIEIVPVSNDDERPVSRYFAKNLLRKERHGKALAASLRVPEDTEFPLVLT